MKLPIVPLQTSHPYHWVQQSSTSCYKKIVLVIGGWSPTNGEKCNFLLFFLLLGALLATVIEPAVGVCYYILDTRNSTNDTRLKNMETENG